MNAPAKHRSKFRVKVIVPCVVVHNLDPHTGIPFLPHMAAHFAGALDAAGYEVQVIDCFGISPNRRRREGQFMFLGVDEAWVSSAIEQEVDCIYIYCRTVEDLVSTERLTTKLRHDFPSVPIGIFENIQTVNSFALKEIAPELLERGASVCILGEPERRAKELTRALIERGDLSTIKSVVYRVDNSVTQTESEPPNLDLDSLPLPLWEKFPMEGYWKAGFTHAPIKRGEKFLPILTSRGCPLKCTFCIAPGINPKWRGRSGQSVADEMEYFYKTLGVTDFHISDLNPTVKDSRTRDMCEKIIEKNLPITWKVAQGTKIETIKNDETLELMRKAGCTFLSFSPETGSQRLIRIMRKSFDYEYALIKVRKANSLGIRTQACFIAGVPGENKEDRRLSTSYVKKLVAVGLDEIAVTIFTPLPGAYLSNSLEGFKHHSELTHSPTWRKDYDEVNRYRRRMYLTFFLSKSLFPRKVIREVYGFLTQNFETKMEMSIFKIIKLYLLYFVPFLYDEKVLYRSKDNFSDETRTKVLTRMSLTSE